MKIIIDIKGEFALVFWRENNAPYLTCLMEDRKLRIGDIIPSWYHGNYFLELKDAVEDLEKRGN